MKNNNNKYFITIEEPCNEDWEQMVPNKMGKHCASCNKTVIDFSTLSDNEIFRILSKESEKRICGQFHTYQLNRFITETNLRRTNPKLYKIILGLLFLTSSVELSAQQTKNHEQSLQTNEFTPCGDSLITIVGKVGNSNGAPIEDVLIRIASTNRQVMSDAQGKFQIAVTLGDTLIVNKNNFVEKKIRINSSDILSVTLVGSNIKKESSHIVIRGAISSISRADPLVSYRWCNLSRARIE